MIIAIIQARMSSSRLPGKVLLPLANHSVLWHTVNRVRHCQKINKIIVATSTDDSDDPIYNHCQNINVECYRGSLTDVLDRYYQCAKQSDPLAIVRITADCPALDPEVICSLVEFFISNSYDYCCLKEGYPDGLDCEVFTFNALEKAWKGATLNSDREHVTSFINNTNKDQFSIGYLQIYNSLEHMRWTLDEPDDYEFLKLVFGNLHRENSVFLTNEILHLIAANPWLTYLNSHIARNAGYQKSLAEDLNIKKIRRIT